MSRRHSVTSSWSAAARLMIGIGRILGKRRRQGKTAGRARQGSKSSEAGQGGRPWLTAKAQIETLCPPGGLDRVKVGSARRIGLARRPGGTLRPAPAPDAKQSCELAQRVGVIVDA